MDSSGVGNLDARGEGGSLPGEKEGRRSNFETYSVPANGAGALHTQHRQPVPRDVEWRPTMAACYDSCDSYEPAPARERRSESKAAAERRGGRRRRPRGPRKGGQEGATAKGRVRRQLPAQQERGGASRERARGRSAHLTPAAASASSPRWFTALQCERCEQSPGVRLFFTFLPTYLRLQATETFCLLHSI